MKQFVLICAFLGLAFAAPSLDRQGEIDIDEWEKNGTYPYRPTIGGRIVGGTVTTINQFPWQVAILRNGAQICGGVIVAARVILTAAHCVAPSIIPSIASLNIRSGATNHNAGGLRVATSRLIIHASYRDCSNCAPDFDIAVIHLSANAVASGIPAAFIPLWEATTTFPVGILGTVTGWGAIREDGPGSLQLRRVDLPIISAANCRAVYGSIISSRTICAGFANGGRDSCQGDSGGPFVIQNRLAGLVSFGAGCARPGLPGVYSSIPGYRAWIRTNAGV